MRLRIPHSIGIFLSLPWILRPSNFYSRFFPVPGARKLHALVRFSSQTTTLASFTHLLCHCSRTMLFPSVLTILAAFSGVHAAFVRAALP